MRTHILFTIALLLAFALAIIITETSSEGFEVWNSSYTEYTPFMLEDLETDFTFIEGRFDEWLRENVMIVPSFINIPDTWHIQTASLTDELNELMYASNITNRQA